MLKNEKYLSVFTQIFQNFVNVFCCNLEFVMVLMFLDELEKLDCISLNISLTNNRQSIFINQPKSFEIQIGAIVKKKFCHFEMEVIAGIWAEC